MNAVERDGLAALGDDADGGRGGPVGADDDATVAGVRAQHVVRIRVVALDDQLDLALDADPRDAHDSTRRTCAWRSPGTSRT